MSDLNRNLKLFPIYEVLRALIFTVPIWVAYELQYISLGQLTVIESIIFISQLVLELPTGAVADIFGRKTSLWFGALLLTISMAIFGFATNFTMFVIFALFCGAGDAFVSGAREALLYDTYKELGQEKNMLKAMGKLGLYFQGGLALAIILGGFMAMQDIRLPIWSQVVMFGLAIVVAFLFVEPSIDSQKFTLHSYFNQIKEGMLETIKNQQTALSSLFYILIGGLTWTCMLAFNNMLLTTLGYVGRDLGILIGVVRILNAFVLFRLIRFERLATERVSYIGFTILVLVGLLPAVFLTKWSAIPFIVILMFSSSARWSVLAKFVNDRFSSAKRATAISFLSMAIGLFYAVTLLISGPVIEWAGSVGAFMTLMGVFALFTVLPLGLILAKNYRENS